MIHHTPLQPGHWSGFFLWPPLRCCRKWGSETIAFLSEGLAMAACDLAILVMNRARHTDPMVDIPATGPGFHRSPMGCSAKGLKLDQLPRGFLVCRQLVGNPRQTRVFRG